MGIKKMTFFVRFLSLNVLFLSMFICRVIAEDVDSSFKEKDFSVVSPRNSLVIRHEETSESNWFVNLEGKTAYFSRNKPMQNAYLLESDLPFSIPNDSEIKTTPQDKIIFPVSDGYLVALKGGLFEASLWWFSKDGNKKERIGYNRPHEPFSFVNGFFTSHDQIFVLYGSDFVRSGGIYKIYRNTENVWQVSDIYLFDTSASTNYFKIDDDNFLILTNRKVVSFSPVNGGYTLWEVMRNGGDFSCEGNSIVRDSRGRIFIGGKNRVIRLTPQKSGLKEEWLIPNK